MSEPVKLTTYQGDVFRAFSTAYPTQELLDDLLEDPADRDTLKPLYYTPDFPEDMDRIERVIRRSVRAIIQDEIKAKFQPQKWYPSRFSDGTWPVLYSAEDDVTARAESLFYKRRFMKEEIEKGPVTIDLRIVRLFVNSEKSIDLTRLKKLNFSKLTSQDELGYPYCQKLAREYRKKNAELFRSHSARHKEGICVPIFNRNAIEKDYGHLEYLKCIFQDDRTEIFSPE